MTSPVKFSTVPPLASDKDEDYTFSQTDKCSLFLCQGGELDIVLEDKTSKQGLERNYAYSRYRLYPDQ